MKKNGFTLIELLAVIIILSLILSIAVPIVLNLIKDSKDSSKADSVELYGRAVDSAIANYFMKNPEEDDVTLEMLEQGGYLQYKGSRVECTNTIINDRKVYLSDCKVGNKRITATYGEYVAGAYDLDDKLIADWDTLVNTYHLDIEYDYHYTNDTSDTMSYLNFNDNHASMYYVLNNNDFDNITKIVIPTSITKIGEASFAGCEKIKNIVIPNSVTTIGNSAFRGCSGLTNIIIPSSVTTLNSHIFHGCSRLTSIILSSQISTIASSAFEDCSGLTNIKIPKSVKTIENSAFSGCDDLETVKFENTTGWYIVDSISETSGTNIDVTNDSTNATNLKTTYVSKIWKTN